MTKRILGLCAIAAFSSILACGSSGDGGATSGGASDAGGDGPTSGGAGSDGGSSGDAGDGGPMVNPNPTVSSWLGTNVSADLPRVDVTYQLNPFDTPAAQKDANGYPQPGVAGTSQTDIGFVLPTGSYKISYRGTGTLNVSGIGKLAGAWKSAGGEQRNEVQINGSPGSFGQMLTLVIANGAGQSVTDIHIYFPGFDYDAKDVFLPQLIGVLSPFRALRFMDWEETNNSTIVDWAARPRASSFGHASAGEPYEHIVELVNVTGKDMWITIPEHASDDFVHQLGKLLAQSLDAGRIASARAKAGFTTPFQIIVENSNETWNNGFSAYSTFLTAAKADAARYDGKYTGTYGPSWMTQNADLMKVGQYEGDRLVKIATILKGELGPFASALAPVLSGWALGAGYSDVALRFIKANYGDPKNYLSYVALAPYFGPEDSATGALDTLFASADANIASMEASFTDFKKLADEWGVRVVAYEGGQGISGNTNLTIKHLAQHDSRMHDSYAKYFALWKKVLGESLFMHFSLSGVPGLPENIYQYGFWGSIIGVLEDRAACAASIPVLTGAESVASVVHHCPKYKALAEQVP